MAASVDLTGAAYQKSVCVVSTAIACPAAYIARIVLLPRFLRRIGICFRGGPGTYGVFANGDIGGAIIDGTTDLVDYPSTPGDSVYWIPAPEGRVIAFGHSVVAGEVALHLDFSDDVVSG